MSGSTTFRRWYPTSVKKGQQQQVSVNVDLLDRLYSNIS